MHLRSCVSMVKPGIICADLADAQDVHRQLSSPPVCKDRDCALCQVVDKKFQEDSPSKSFLLTSNSSFMATLQDLNRIAVSEIKI